MAQDLIVSFLSAVPPGVLARFAVKPLTLAVPVAPVGHGRAFYADWLSKVRDGKGNVIPGMFKMAGGSGSIGRVAVIGFSNGVDSGVSQVLDSNDAQKIDFIGAFDGVHGSFAPGTTQLFPSTYGKWIAFALLAAASKSPEAPTMVVTHSSIEPPFPSTTETANLLWNEVVKRIPQDFAQTYFSELDDVVYPGGLQIRSIDTAQSGKPMPTWSWQSFNDGWYDRRNANSFSVFGWGDPGKSPLGRIQARTRDTFNGTADHIFQASAVLPAILNAYLVGRWNPLCGPLPTDGFGADPEACTPGGGRSYDAGPDGPLANPFTLGVSLPTPPVSCPYPGPGKVLVGTAKNPCSTESAPIPAPPAPGSLQASGGPSLAGKVALGLAAAGAGFLGARWALRRREARA